MKIKTGIGYNYTVIKGDMSSYLEEKPNIIEVFDRNDEHLGSLVFENIKLKGVLYDASNESLNKVIEDLSHLLHFYLDEVMEWAFPKIRGQGELKNETNKN